MTQPAQVTQVAQEGLGTQVAGHHETAWSYTEPLSSQGR